MINKLTIKTLGLAAISMQILACDPSDNSANSGSPSQNSTNSPQGNSQNDATNPKHTRASSNDNTAPIKDPKKSNVPNENSNEPKIVEKPITETANNPAKPSLITKEQKETVKAKVFNGSKWSIDPNDYKEVIDQVPKMKTDEDFVSQILLSNAKKYGRIENMLITCINSYNTAHVQYPQAKILIEQLTDLASFKKYCMPENAQRFENKMDNPSQFFIKGKIFMQNGVEDFAKEFNKTQKFDYKSGFFGINTRTAFRMTNTGFTQLLLEEYYLFAFAKSLQDFGVIKEFKGYYDNSGVGYLEIIYP